MSTKNFTLIAFLSLVMFSSATVRAQIPKQELKYGMTDMEISLLPDYCRARLVGDAQAKDYWSKRIGNDKFIHLHHYCSGLNAFNQARTTIDRRTRAAKLEFAVHEFDYVLRAWPGDFALAKEAQNMKAQTAAMH